MIQCVLHRVAVSCSVLQCCSVNEHAFVCVLLVWDAGVMQCVTVCCSVVQCVAVSSSVLQCVAVRISVQQCAAVNYSVNEHNIIRALSANTLHFNLHYVSQHTLRAGYGLWDR